MMKEMRRIRNFMLLVMISIAFASCLGGDTETEFIVFTDVYVLKKMTGDEEVYARTFYAYSNQVMRTASATEMGGSGEMIDLSQDSRSLYTMSKTPVESDYNPDPPTTSEYQFQVTSENGITKESNDFLSYDDIAIPEITTTEFTENNKYLKVAWTEVAGTDGYLIKILNTEGIEIIESYGFDPGVLEYTINITLENWVEIPEQGKTYIIEVNAYAYEPEFEPGYDAYNIQEVSIAETEIIWP